VRVLVFGAFGLLGRHVVRELRAREHDVEPLNRGNGDVTSSAAGDAILAHRPDAVVNCAAWANSDTAEDHPRQAFEVNELGAGQVAQAAFVVGARLVHVSTNFVYREEQDAVNQLTVALPERSPLPPQGAYARSKWAGDELVLARDPENVVLRTQSLYGVGGGNYVSRVVDMIRAGKSPTLDPERSVAPTSAAALADFVVHLLAHMVSGGRYAGVVHYQCRGQTTWYDWGCRLSEQLGVPPVVVAYRPPYCAPRPRVTLACDLAYPVPTWQEAQDAYVAELLRPCQ